ncbi:signal transduction histidine kinase [Kutzneria buriramensis]|uniref:Signal transduction histidine kinase n=1 Tax=Kutzneria buriramensis TaxID=1045776 RepID=A0A3E0HTR9_9PSEU|nr:signal transduction histidine kinase [Kutzneria buriramensis]
MVRNRPAIPGISPDDDPATPFWRGLIVLRIVTWAFALGSIWLNAHTFAVAWAGWLVAGVMTVWTGVLTFFYVTPPGRLPQLVIADLVLNTVLMLSSVPIVGPAQLQGGAQTITTLWSAAVPVGGAIYGGRYWGLLFGGITAVANVLPRGYFNIYLAEDTVLLIGVSFVVGVATEATRNSADRVRQALRTEAATAERERLARSIHDGVLQVLARVRKRGLEVGGEAAEIAELAGEQEIALRSLIASGPLESTVDGDTDLRQWLQLMATPSISVAAPATPVLVPQVTAGELAAAVREALSNVDKHAGSAARAWVLLEDLGGEVVLSVRDDGVGIADGRLAAAEAEGHLGVSQSIRGRIADLGGTVELTTAPGEGTEWELHVPTGGSR